MKKRIVLLISVLLLITSCDKNDVPISEVRVKNSSPYELKDIALRVGDFGIIDFGNLSSNSISIYKDVASNAGLVKISFEYNNKTASINTGDFGNVGMNFNNDTVIINIYYSEELGIQAEYLDE